MDQNTLLIAIRLKEMYDELLILILLQYNLYLNNIRLNKCVTKQFINVVLCLILFLIKKTSRNMWRNCFLYPFLIVYCLDKDITQRMCDEAVGDSIAVCYNKNIYTVLYAGDGLLFFDEGTGDITFR